MGRTILPWTSLWLHFYEIWLVTGVWHGGGEHSDDGARDEVHVMRDIVANHSSMH